MTHLTRVSVEGLLRGIELLRGGLEPEVAQTLTSVMEVHLRNHGYSFEELGIAASMRPDHFTTHYRPPGDEGPSTQLRLIRS